MYFTKEKTVQHCVNSSSKTFRNEEWVSCNSVSFVDMLLGIHGGMMGETCVIAILLGLAYLLFTHTIEFTIPASIVGTMYVLTLLVYP